MSEITRWMKRKLQDAPRVTRGESEACGHPHSWCGLVIPDWEWRQMIDVAEKGDKDLVKLEQELDGVASDYDRALRNIP